MVLGLLIKMKTNQIIQGDVLEELKKLPDKSIDLIITDPPYNLGINYGKDKDKRKDYDEWCLKWIKQCERVLKARGAMYIINYPENACEILLNTEKFTSLELRRWITWHYHTNIGHSKRNWTRSQRAILFFTKEQPYKFNLKEGEEIQDFIKMNLVKNTSKEKIKGFPNQIPEKLISLLIELSSNEGDLILDPFTGSGTTLVVAKRMDRNFIGIELNPQYIKIIQERIKKVI